MTTVKVFRFEKYDITIDEWQTSRRWATEDAIEEVGGRAIASSVQVDQTVLGGEVKGMTNRDFNPRSSGGFQRTMMSGY